MERLFEAFATLGNFQDEDSSPPPAPPPQPSEPAPEPPAPTPDLPEPSSGGSKDAEENK